MHYTQCGDGGDRMVVLFSVVSLTVSRMLNSRSSDARDTTAARPRKQR